MGNSAQISEARRRLLQRYLSTPAMRQRAVTISSAIGRRQPGGHAPPMLAQAPIWRRAQTPGIPPLYNETITIHRTGHLDAATLQRCLTEVVRRHEIWRTVFAVIDGDLRQIVQHAPASIPLPYTDLRHLPEPLGQAEALRLATEDVQCPFDLATGPLFRARLSQLANDKYWISMTAHQIILDGVSVYKVLLPELAELYDAYSSGRAPQLPELPIQCADFAVWQREWLRGEVLDKQLDHWRKQLAGASGMLNWPSYRVRPPVQTFRGRIQPFKLSEEAKISAKALSQRERVTLFTVLTTAFVVLLHRYSGQQDMIIGTVAPAGRKRSETQHLLGYFLNPVALRFQVADIETTTDLLQQAREVISGALSHDDVPFECVVERIGPQADPSRNPFFQVAISQEPPLPDLPGWSLTPMDVQNGGARWDLYLVLDDRSGGIIGRVQYNPDLFDGSDIDRMLLDYEALLKCMNAAPNAPVGALGVSPSADAAGAQSSAEGV